MRSRFYISFCIVLLYSCQNTNPEESIVLNEDLLLYNLKAISHDSLQGRFFGTEGNYKTQTYIAKQFDSLGLTPAFSHGSIQKFPFTFKKGFRQRVFPIAAPADDFSNVPDTTVNGGNVVALVRGKSEKAIVITAHFDHLGMNGTEVYNGADDNASGVSALLSLANYFKNKPLKHTLIFAAVDAEEIESLGSEYLLNNFPAKTENIVLNVNLDMISHSDSSELYAVGLYHYPYLKQTLLDIKSENISLLFGHDDPNNKNEEDWTYSSDHSNFHRRNIPFVYFGVESHEDFHQPTDTYSNINKDFYVNSVNLIAQAIKGFDSYLSDNSRNR